MGLLDGTKPPTSMIDSIDISLLNPRSNSHMKATMAQVFGKLVFVTIMTCFGNGNVNGDIVATDYFGGKVYRFDQAGNRSDLFDAAVLDGVLPGAVSLDSLAYDAANNRIFAGGRDSGKIYQFNAETGQAIASGEFASGLQASGIASLAYNNGSLYVSNGFSNTISVFNSAGSLTTTLTLPSSPGGIAFDSSGDLLVATGSGFAGGYLGIYEFTNGAGAPSLLFGPGTTSVNVPGAIVSDGSGNVYLADVFSDSVYKYNASGGSTYVTLPQQLGGFFLAAPSGLTLNENGNLVIAGLGATNPNDPGGTQGYLSVFDGVTLQSITNPGSPSLSSVLFVPAVTAVPEPGSILGAALLGLGALVARRRSQGKDIGY